MITKLCNYIKEATTDAEANEAIRPSVGQLAADLGRVGADIVADDVPFVGAGFLAQKFPVKRLQNKIDAYANRIIDEPVQSLQVSKDFIEKKMLPRYGFKSTDVPISSLVGANGKGDATIVGKELQHIFNKNIVGGKEYKALNFLRKHPYLLTPLGAKATYDANRDNAAPDATRGAVMGNIAAMAPHIAATADDITSSAKSIRTLKELGYDKEAIKAAKRKLRASAFKKLAPALAFHGIMNAGAVAGAKVMNLRDIFKQLSAIRADHFAAEKKKEK